LTFFAGIVNFDFGPDSGPAFFGDSN